LGTPLLPLTESLRLGDPLILLKVKYQNRTPINIPTIRIKRRSNTVHEYGTQILAPLSNEIVHSFNK